MSKLLKLKKYLTLTDATNYLSNVLEEQISMADLYELALEGHLAISIRFLKQNFATETIKISEEALDTSELQAKTVLPANSEKRVHYINGAYDLAMIGLEKYEIRKLHHRETGLPEPMLAELNGYFIRDQTTVYQLLDSLPVSKNEDIQKIVETELETLLISKRTSVQSLLENPDEIFEQLDSEETEQIMALLNPFGIEQDGTYLIALKDFEQQLVVRRDELDRFIAALEQIPEDVMEEKSLHPPEKRSFLKLVGILLHALKIDPTQKGVSSALRLMSQQAGISISDNTIRKILEETADALD